MLQDSTGAGLRYRFDDTLGITTHLATAHKKPLQHTTSCAGSLGQITGKNHLTGHEYFIQVKCRACYVPTQSPHSETLIHFMGSNSWFTVTCGQNEGGAISHCCNAAKLDVMVTRLV